MARAKKKATKRRRRRRKRPSIWPKLARDWIGLRVVSKRGIRTGIRSVPEGTVFVVRLKHGTLTLEGLPCETCRVSVVVRKVAISTVEPAGAGWWDPDPNCRDCEGKGWFDPVLFHRTREACACHRGKRPTWGDFSLVHENPPR